MEPTWITWTSKPGGPYDPAPRSTVAHAAPASVGRTANVTSGGYPLACGRLAPDGWDALLVADPYARRCRRCTAALQRVETEKAAKSGLFVPGPHAEPASSSEAAVSS